MANFKAVGRIVGNPLCGLCERMCIQADTVFDACTNRFNNLTAVLELSDFSGGVTAPFTYTGACSLPEPAFVLEQVCSESPGCCRIRGALTLNVVVSYTDAEGVAGCAKAVLKLNRNLCLKVPQDTLAPYTFTGDAILRSSIGSFLTSNTVAITYCIVETFKTIVKADILVPTYGYAVYPRCETCADECRQFLDKTLFPAER